MKDLGKNLIFRLSTHFSSSFGLTPKTGYFWPKSAKNGRFWEKVYGSLGFSGFGRGTEVGNFSENFYLKIFRNLNKSAGKYKGEEVGKKYTW